MQVKNYIRESREDRRRSFGIGGAGNIRMSYRMLAPASLEGTEMSASQLADPWLTILSYQAPRLKQSSTTCSRPSARSSGGGAAS